MKIEAIIVADSISPQGNRIVTFELIYPRIIHSEVMTHRLFSKNSASSRAIPFSKMVKAVEENPFIPIAWQKQHSGMQGNEYFTDHNEIITREHHWLVSRDNAVKGAKVQNEFGVTKQLCNRLLEPFMYHKVLLTATEFDNFFELRCPQYHTPVSGEGFYFKSKKECIKNHSNPENIAKLEAMSDLDWLQINKGQSEIHMMQLAECMWDAMNESIPKQLKAGEWHIPYGYETNNQAFTNFKMEKWKNIQVPSGDFHIDLLLKISTAKCARTSYTTVGEDGKEIPYEKDIALHDSLIASGHMSPTEHIAVAMSDEEYNDFIKGKKVVTHSEPEYDDLYEFDETSIGWCLNYRGFIQYRYLLQNQ